MQHDAHVVIWARWREISVYASWLNEARFRGEQSE